ncbi:sigma factor-like helix-turn-helix DNA-binding protein [Nocardia amamiensis]|uniref:sigma factor-like helix-turn-helix DNA-binding protein n=1 Tax=Nocardia amamiensis TaxID=404578 RepID=UPI002B4AFB83|nr:sigma factor-like helix-turn-helix DNA-binding protein [Nocardia amamiensis]
MAMLVVLESLTPLERAVFVLNEVFAYPHTEIADMVDRSPAAVRQIAHRARAHVQARRPRTQVDPLIRQEVTERFVDAAMGGNPAKLTRVNDPNPTR